MTTDKCPCGKQHKKSFMKQCIKCVRWWHAQCVTLQGLGEKELNLLKTWVCPLCYTLPEGVVNGNQQNVSKTDIETVVQSQTNKIIKEIKSVKAAVITKDNLKELVAATLKNELDKNLDEQSNKWSNVLQDNREETSRVISQTINENNSRVIHEVVNNSKQQMDADQRERDLRKCNVVINDLGESTARLTNDKVREDLNRACQVLGVEQDEIVKVWRSGPPKQGERPRPRSLIVTVINPELANQLHDYGRGVKRVCTSDRHLKFWVNPDLIKADRDANFNAREAARARARERGHQRQPRIEVGRRNMSPVSPRSSRLGSPARRAYTPTSSVNGSPRTRSLSNGTRHSSANAGRDLE